MMEQEILVLGVGNILLHDEGVGVHIVCDLEEQFTFSDNVQLLDGGTLGIRLLDAISKADFMIVVDAFCDNKAPGQLSRLGRSELMDRVASKNSLHQVSFLETMAYAEILGVLPDVVLIGCEPENLEPWGTGLSATVEAAKPGMITMIAAEIRNAGGSMSPISGDGN